MKNKKKLLLILIFTLLFTAISAACSHKDDNPTSPISESITSEPVTEPVTNPVAEPVTEPVAEPTHDIVPEENEADTDPMTFAIQVFESEQYLPYLPDSQYTLLQAAVKQYDNARLLVCLLTPYWDDTIVIHAFYLNSDNEIVDSLSYGGLRGSVETTENGDVHITLYDNEQGWTLEMDGLIELEDGQIVYPERHERSDPGYHDYINEE